MRSVGVEEELLLVEPGTGRALPVAGDVLEHAKAWPDDEVRGWGGELIESELQQQQLEIHTRPLTDLDELDEELRAARRTADQVARAAGARIAATGLYPSPIIPVATPSERYRQMVERFGPLAADNLTCGCHMHVSVEDQEEAVGVIDRIRVWLPVLLAVSANSPYKDGVDTAYASYRALVQHRWPTSGPTEIFGSAAAYEHVIESMLATGVPQDRGMIYFDVRASHRYPTIEIRVADVCMDAADSVLLAALGRAMVDTAAADLAAGVPVPAVPAAVVRVAHWQAARHGMAGDLVDPVSWRPRPAWDVVGDLVDRLRPALRGTDDETRVDQALARLRSVGTGSAQQRRLHAREGTMRAVMDHVVQVTVGEND